MNALCGCLSIETKVDVYQDQPKAAADIEVGDKLVSAEGCPEIVVSAAKSIQPLIRLAWRGGNIIVSRSHHFLDSAGTEVLAETLAMGDEILGVDSEPCEITGLEEAGEGEVISLSCLPSHVYRAAGLLHHNKAQPHRISPGGALMERTSQHLGIYRSAIQQGCALDPVRNHPYSPEPNPHTGELIIDPDIVLKAQGFNLELNFFYSSIAGINAELGPGWSGSHRGYVVTQIAVGGGDTYDVVRGDFSDTTYSVTGTSGGLTYFTPSGGASSTSSLVFNGSEFTETFPDGMQMVYANQGALTGQYTKFNIVQVAAASGLTQTYTYGSGATAGLLQSIMVPGGRLVTFSYASSAPTSLLQSVGDWSGRLWTFQYDAQRNLKSFTTPTGCQTQYATDAVTSLISAITDPRGFTTSFTYSAGQIATKAAGTAVWSWIYNSGPGAGTDVFQTPVGARITYVHSAAVPVGVLLAEQRPEGYIITRTYNGNRQILTEQVPYGYRYSVTYSANFAQVLASEDALGNISSYQYDAVGNQTTTIDALGNIWTQIFDNSRNRTATVDPLGRRNTFSFDSFGQMLSAQDGRGLLTSFLYDGYGNQTTQVNSDGGVVSRTFDWLNRRISETDPIGRTTSWIYDPSDSVVSLITADGAVQQFIYNTCLLIAKVDQLGYRTSYSYGRFQNLLTMQNALGYTWSTLYDNMAYATGSVDPLGYQTTTVYNAAKQQTATVDQLGFATSFFYDSTARPLATQDALGFRTSTVYNARNAIARQDALGSLWSTTFDPLDRVIASINPLGFTSWTIFDAAGQSIATVDPLGFRTTHVFDSASNRISTTDPNGFVSTSVYAATSTRLAASVDPNGFVTSYVYDLASQKLARQNAQGSFISFAYDRVGREASAQNEIGLTTSYVFDLGGRRFSRQFPNGDLTQYGYDAASQPLTAVYADGTILTTAYEARGLMATMVDVTGTTTYAFDVRGSMSGKTDPGPLVQAYVYDAIQNCTKLTDPDGGVHSFVFDGLRRPSALANAAGGRYTYQYDAASRATTLSSSYGEVEAIAFDNVGRQTSLIQYSGANPVVTVIDAFDGAGRKTSRSLNGLLTSYVYDAGTRLTGQNGTGVWATMSYDSVGNTTLKWNQGSNPMTMSYDAASRLVTQTLGAVVTTYVFDLNGNTTVERSGGVSTGFSFDKENRMKGVQHSDGSLSTSVYAGDGLRRLRQEPSDAMPHTIIWHGRDYLMEY